MTRGYFIALVLAVVVGVTLAELAPWWFWPLGWLAFGVIAGYASVDFDDWFGRRKAQR